MMSNLTIIVFIIDLGELLLGTSILVTYSSYKVYHTEHI